MSAGLNSPRLFRKNAKLKNPLKILPFLEEVSGFGLVLFKEIRV